jgi:hypothetical protein
VLTRPERVTGHTEHVSTLVDCQSHKISQADLDERNQRLLQAALQLGNVVIRALQRTNDETAYSAEQGTSESYRVIDSNQERRPRRVIESAVLQQQACTRTRISPLREAKRRTADLAAY